MLRVLTLSRTKVGMPEGPHGLISKHLPFPLLPILVSSECVTEILSRESQYQWKYQKKLNEAATEPWLRAVYVPNFVAGPLGQEKDDCL